MLIDNPMIFYAYNDLVDEDNMFNMLGGNVDNFPSLGLVGTMPPLIHIACT